MSTSTNWQLAREAAERYESVLVPAILGPFARALVERMGPDLRGVVVDVGCGTGAVARYVAKQGGTIRAVVALDNNPGMIDVARAASPSTASPTIDWYVGTASHLPIRTDSADVVLCGQTLQFLARRDEAVAEMRRVLKPTGRVAASVWCTLGQNPYFEAVVTAVAAHIGADVAAGLNAAFSLGEAAAVRDSFSAAGFPDVAVSRMQLDLKLPDLAEFVPRHIAATPMALPFASAPADIRAAIVSDIRSRLIDFTRPDGRVRAPFRSHVVIAGDAA